MNIKKEIELDLLNLRMEDAKEKIELLEKEYPHDLDIYSIKAIYAFHQGDIVNAINECKKGLEKNIYNYDLNYNIAVFYENNNQLFLAYEYYVKARTIKEFCKDDNRDIVIKALMDDEKRVVFKIEENANEINSPAVTKQIIEDIKVLNQNNSTNFGLMSVFEWAFGFKRTGQIFEDSDGAKLFAGNHQHYLDTLMANDYINRKVDVRRVWKHSNNVQFITNETIILPVSSLDEDVILNISENGIEYSFKLLAKSYYYYRLHGDIKITASSEVVFGERIYLRREKGKKALVLNIFVDGLSSVVLEQYGLRNLMPETYKYFADGVSCNNMYTSSDWTYPSLASLNTGTYLTNHKLYHPHLCGELPRNYATLAECFHNASYTTAKIDGDWRSTPNYGYSRGMDRIIFKRRSIANEIIPDAIEHIEFMKDTNQFVWLCVSNLHDIADGLELRASVQKDLNLETRFNSNVSGSTSVKQGYNVGKITKYKEQIKYVDMYLGLLYSYINSNFADEDIIVTLFSDHGQGYLLQEEEFFLADARTKVPLFIKDNKLKKGYGCNELISAVDYMGIICELANAPYDISKTDGNLPLFFNGSKEREYIYIESLHPGDPYYAAVRDNERVLHFSTTNCTENDGRIILEPYSALLYDSAGNIIEDDEMKGRYLHIVFEHIKEYIIYNSDVDISCSR